MAQSREEKVRKIRERRRTPEGQRIRRESYNRTKLTVLAQQRQRKYKISDKNYTMRLSLQRGACVICKEPDDVLCVDHDHGCCDTRASCCGECVRSLLCKRCNMALGAFHDSPEILERAIAYLAYWRKHHGR